MELITAANSWLNGAVWGLPMVVLLIGTGVVLTVITKGIQFRKFVFSFREVVTDFTRKSEGEGSVSPSQALATALASTVGVGNIAGVSSAISVGGPGAIFWLAVSGVLGMSTKFAETAIALHYREKDANGIMRGGAMYVLSHMKMPWLGAAFALFTSIAAFGIGNMVQANSVAESVNSSFGVPHWITGSVLVVLTALVVLGGIKRIAEVAYFLVPIMCLLYMTGAAVILIRFAGEIPGVLAMIFHDAFSSQAAVGGFVGTTVRQAMTQGLKRGLFSNEAGLGSAPIVHASAVCDHPIRQACYGMFGVFVDTLVICMMTAGVVLVTRAWETGETAAVLSARAFSIGLPGEWGHYTVSIGLITFAFSTIVGWSFYGETAVTYLFGTKAELPYRLLWIIFVYLGATGSLQTIWDISDTLNGLMAIPNLVAVLGSLGLLLRLIREFFHER